MTSDQTFEVLDLGDDKIAIKSVHGKYLSANKNDTKLVWMSGDIDENKTFTKELNSNG